MEQLRILLVGNLQKQRARDTQTESPNSHALQEDLYKMKCVLVNRERLQQHEQARIMQLAWCTARPAPSVNQCTHPKETRANMRKLS